MVGLRSSHFSGTSNQLATAIILFNDMERKIAEGVVHRMVKRAVEMEGTVTGEHGVGLVKRDYLEHELGETTVDAMRRVSISGSLNVLLPSTTNADETSTAKTGTRPPSLVKLRQGYSNRTANAGRAERVVNASPVYKFDDASGLLGVICIMHHCQVYSQEALQ